MSTDGARSGTRTARAGLPLAWRIFLGTSGVVAAVLGGALWWTSRSADRAADASAARTVASMRAEVAAFVDGDARGLTDGAAVFVRSAAFRSLIQAGARADVLDQTREAAEQLRASWVQVVDARGVRLAKSDEPAGVPASLAESPLVRDALAGRARASFGTIGDTALAHVVAVPIEGVTPGMVVGALMVARPLDANAAQARASNSGEVLFLLLPRTGAPRATAATRAVPPAALVALGAMLTASADTAAPTANLARTPTDVRLDDAQWLALGQPLRTAAGRVAGGFVVLRSHDAELAVFASLRRAILVAGAAGLLVALLVSSVVARQVTRPLAALAHAARRAADGEYTAPIVVRTRDEVGTLAAAFQALLGDLREKQVLVEFARLTPGRTAGRRWAATPSPGTRAVADGTAPRSLPTADAGATRADSEALANYATTPLARTALRLATAGDGHGELRTDAGGAGTPMPREDVTRSAPMLDATPSASERPVRRSVTREPSLGGNGVRPDVLTAAAALRPGQLFAKRYRVEQMVGAGGTGVVFRTRDTVTDRLVALKVLRPDVAQDDPAALARLMREADTARQLDHPNVVRTFELGEAEGLHFLTMEFVDGPSLREMIDERGWLPLDATIASVRQLARALEHAHARGVLHRDIKPHNCVVTEHGLLKVMDFGIARFASAPRGITETGIVIGTPAYMAPEVLRGGTFDERADIYAVGAVLYECLVGRPPFEQEGSALMLVTRVLEAEPPDPSAARPEVPRALADLTMDALAKDPGARPSDAAVLSARLAAF